MHKIELNLCFDALVQFDSSFMCHCSKKINVVCYGGPHGSLTNESEKRIYEKILKILKSHFTVPTAKFEIENKQKQSLHEL